MPNWVDRIYFSTNELWDAQDQALVGPTHNQSLAPGASYTVTNNATVPSVRYVTATWISSPGFAVSAAPSRVREAVEVGIEEDALEGAHVGRRDIEQLE